jgi:hypothetical protein
MTIRARAALLALWACLGMACRDAGPTGPWRFAIVDAEGRPTAARVALRTTDGRAVAPAGVRAKEDFAGEAYFYTDGRFSLETGETELDVRVHKGFEVRPVAQRVARGKGETRLVLERVFDLAARGFRSGDGHVHPFALVPTHVPGNAELLLEMKAEDLHLANLLAGNIFDANVPFGDRITGRDEPESEPDRVLRFSEEYRGNFYGHMVVFGAERLSDPVYTSFEGTPWPFDYPMNLDAARRYRRDGDLASFAHLQPQLNLSVEFPIDVVLGALSAVEVQGYAVSPSVALPIWERMLDCGFDVVLTAGTDVMLGSTKTSVLGGARSYVDLDGRPFSYETYQDQLSRGRSFTTNGPLLFLEVGGKEPGQRIALAPGESRRVPVRVVVESLFPWRRLVVRASQRDALVFERAPDAGERQVFEGEVALDAPGWVYATVTGPPDDHVPQPQGKPRGNRAVTNPVWVDVPGRERRDPAAVDYFRAWIRRVRKVLEARDNFGSPEQRRSVLDTLDRADAAFVARLSPAVPTPP